ncbi:MAG: MYG1 family protein [Chlamydiota bacterium]|nr:MYG1 family protein [Chlamydiota bacterium]
MSDRSFATHNGAFHADEVTACALLLLHDLIDRDKILRTRDPKAIQSSAFVCDVGGVYCTKRQRFDHHQEDYKGKMSSAGMVLKFLKEKKYLSPALYRRFYNGLVREVDAIDNGRPLHPNSQATFSSVIAHFVPNANELVTEQTDAAFMQAVEFALGHLKRIAEKFYFNRKFLDIVRAAMYPPALSCPPLVLSFEGAIPWIDNFFELKGECHPAKFVLMPRDKMWKLRGIPPSSHRRMQVRKQMPKSWAGLSGKELSAASGIPGAVFCHKGLFISIWETKEAALQALQHILGKDSVHSF